MKSVSEIRQSFLDFFASKSHSVLPSGALIPQHDPTLMFINAGMAPLKDIFIGRETRQDEAGNTIVRATSSQKCVRAGGKHNDLDNVGYTARHLTFFEMLGNFSFGDYFKEDAIAYAWEYLTDVLKIPADKLLVTVYHTDDEAFDIWKRVTNFPDEKIIRIATNDNFWSMGDTGPCGPCSEIFYDHGPEIEGGPPGSPDEDGDRFVEIWNLVFMQFEKHADGTQTDLPKPCIDTGMGLERMTTVMNGIHNLFETDLFTALIEASQRESGDNDPEMISSHRVIADHLRSSAFLLAEKLRPDNEGRGYVLRRIMRRGMRHAHLLGCTEPLMHKLVPALVEQMGDAYPELKAEQGFITDMLLQEETRFKETLERGLALLDNSTSQLKSGDTLDGEVAFKLYDTYGFPLDLTEDILRGRAINIDHEGFDAAMAEQKTRARAAWKGGADAAADALWFDLKEQHGTTEFLGYTGTKGSGQVLAIVKDNALNDQASAGDEVLVLTNQTPFYAESGGQAGDHGRLFNDSVELTVSDTQKKLGSLHVHVAKIEKGSLAVGDILEMQVDERRRWALRANHSATHLLHAVLRKQLGEHVTQKGSLVEADYFRFDFSHDAAVTSEQLRSIEAEVNQLVKHGGEVMTRVMSHEDAINKAGALALFGEKYGDEVRVLSMGEGDYSVELCGGTHVSELADIGGFIITRESSVSAGVRRIEAKTAQGALEHVRSRNEKLGDAAITLPDSPSPELAELNRDVEGRLEQAEAAAREAKKAAQKQAASQALSAASGDAEAEDVNGIAFLGQKVTDIPPRDLRGIVDQHKKKLGSGVIVIIGDNEGKASIVVGVSDDLTDRLNAVDLVRVGSEALGGKGGGGRPDFAQAGGPDASNADAALDAIKNAIG